MNQISIRPLEVFGDLALLAQSERLGNRLSNRKMKPSQHIGDFIQFIILPLEYVIRGDFKGKGTLGKAQSIACSEECQYTVSNGGGCYVNHEIRTAVRGAHKHFYSPNDPIKHYEPMIRLTVWGDVGRLNNEGRRHIWSLIEGSTKRLAYTADFDKPSMQAFKGLMLASVQNPERLALALSLDWKIYISNQETYKQARVQGLRLYKCPQNNKGDAVSFGCSTCPIACDGQRHVISHGLGDSL